MSDKIFAEIRIRGIKDGNVFGPISTDVAGLDKAAYDGLTKVISDALYALGIKVRAGQTPEKQERR